MMGNGPICIKLFLFEMDGVRFPNVHGWKLEQNIVGSTRMRWSHRCHFVDITPIPLLISPEAPSMVILSVYSEIQGHPV